MKQKQQKNEKGFSIPLVFMVLMIVLIIGMASATVASRNLGFVNKEYHNTRAFYAAESGIARAISRLRDDDEWNGKEMDSTGEEKLSFEDVQVGTDNVFYSVWVYNNFRGTTDIAAYKGVVVPPGYAYILGVGSVGTSPFKKAVKYVGAMAKRTGPFEDMGIFSDKLTTFNGNPTVTAYNSSTGNNESGKANVGTNANDPGSVTANGSSVTIDGSVYVGPGSIIGSGGAIVYKGNPNVTGEEKILTREMPMPAVEIPEGLTERNLTVSSNSEVTIGPGNYDDILSVGNHQNVILEGPGTYVFKGIEFNGRGIISVDTTNGPVKIIMDGDMKAAANTLLGGITTINGNGTPKPTDLLIFGTDNCKNIAVGGCATGYAGIYARKAEVVLHGNPDYYGAIISDKVSLPGNPSFHYDVALSGIIDDLPVIKVTSWTRY